MCYDLYIHYAHKTIKQTFPLALVGFFISIKRRISLSFKRVSTRFLRSFKKLVNQLILNKVCIYSQVEEML